MNTNKNVKNVKNDKNIYFNLFNIYKEKIESSKFGDKIKLIGECKNTSEYNLLSLEEQDKLFLDLMKIKR
jgi:hypothetical protein